MSKFSDDEMNRWERLAQESVEEYLDYMERLDHLLREEDCVSQAESYEEAIFGSAVSDLDEERYDDEIDELLRRM